MDEHLLSTVSSWRWLIELRYGIVLLFSLWLIYRIVRRIGASPSLNCFQKRRISIVEHARESRSGGRKWASFRYAYIFIMLFASLSLFSSGVKLLLDTGYDYVTLPHYAARVMDSLPYQTEGRQTGHLRTLYRVRVSFTDRDGCQRTLYTNVSSGEPRAAGEGVTVGYLPGMERAREFADNTHFFLLCISVMMLVGGFALVMALWFALGRSMAVLWSIAHLSVIYLILPAGMLGLFYLFSLSLYTYFQVGKPDLSWIGVGMLILFDLILFFSLLGYIRLLLVRIRGR